MFRIYSWKAIPSSDSTAVSTKPRNSPLIAIGIHPPAAYLLFLAVFSARNPKSQVPSSASTVKMEVEGRKGDTILTGADELYHDEAFRAKASPFPLVFNVNNFFEISICKPENFLTSADGPYRDEVFRANARPVSDITDLSRIGNGA